MKFLVDAQLPPRLVDLLHDAGHDAIHTSSLSEGNATTDEALIARATEDDRVIVTKDVDFRDSHLVRDLPHRLLLVRTGNVANTQLLHLVSTNLGAIVTALEETHFVEIGQTTLIVHEGGSTE